MARGIEIVQTDRGGKVTYHGPGQLVGYPIVGSTTWWRTWAPGERAGRGPGPGGRRGPARPEDGPDYTGVWVEDRKIASIGVHVARGVTTHGFAVNVENDLKPFSGSSRAGWRRSDDFLITETGAPRGR